ncbi:MAG TPA: cupin domain-containing protein [Solirubrobacterales bacterium]|nr:cupin domain-containing protein [Solirubrobacterales bacterium]
MTAATQTMTRTAAEVVAAERRRFEHSQGPRIVGPRDGDYVELGALGVRFMAWTEETGGGFALVEHPIPPKTLCAPLHRHANEDEYSYVLEGRMGAQLGDEVVYAEAGDFVFKPRNQWHTFWNAGDTECRILEIIAPGGFERFFAEWAAGAEAGSLDQAEIGRRYGFEADLDSVPRLLSEHGLTLPLRV